MRTSSFIHSKCRSPFLATLTLCQLHFFDLYFKSRLLILVFFFLFVFHLFDGSLSLSRLASRPTKPSAPFDYQSAMRAMKQPGNGA